MKVNLPCAHEFWWPLAFFAQGGGGLPERADVPDEFKWRLSGIYASLDDWELDFESIKSDLPKLAIMRGSLGNSARNLLACLKLRDEIAVKAGLLYAYAVMKSHEDTRDSKYQALSNRISTLTVEISSASSFITPEIIAMPESVLVNIVEGDETGPYFKDYRFMLKEIARKKEHVLSEREETLLAKAGDMAGSPEEAFSMLTNADMEFKPIKDEDGNEVEMSDERYIKYVSSRVRSVRKAAFESMYEAYARNKNTIGATFNGMLKTSRFYAEARKYASDIDASLNGPNIPKSVYDNLVDVIERNLAPLHRYMALRRETLRLDEIHMYDIYSPLVENPYRDIPLETAKEMAVKALRPLGDEYAAQVKSGLESGWIDVYPNRGKRGGAYSWGVYSAHPFILLNYNGELSDVSTIVHELGHAMHSFYSHKNQPFPTSDYAIFCAEIASTTNEELLIDYLLRTTEDERKRIYILNQHLERIRATVYRQTMFASFERDVHGINQRGGDTTAEELGRIWKSLNAKYFGPEVVIDEEISLEWARIPHFYSPFYVYQYATGYAAAASLARGITTDGRALPRYIKFLSSGGSDYPIALLRDAGVDMSTPGPILDTIELFSKTLDEVERLLKKI
ncbi:MAG: oligoendopeptidase F [Synergistaceae bacterium]|jgi:oligoendopeptidase F|nr:oligoendopeptidase F [Synergistaceae bacterium]